MLPGEAIDAPDIATVATPRPVRRATKACKTCNLRRVRCNVTEKQPCNNCELANIPCELLVSKRGKYVLYSLLRCLHDTE